MQRDAQDTLDAQPQPTALHAMEQQLYRNQAMLVFQHAQYTPRQPYQHPQTTPMMDTSAMFGAAWAPPPQPLQQMQQFANSLHGSKHTQSPQSHGVASDWSPSSTCSSGQSPPSSEDGAADLRPGGSDWDLLSNLLMDDAPSCPAPQYHQVQQIQHLHAQTASPLTTRITAGVSANSPSAVTSAVSTTANISPSQRARAAAAATTGKRSRSTAQSTAAKATSMSRPGGRSRGRGRGRGKSREREQEPAIKTEPPTAEELKKLRRREQIASSVQRHREKKKCVVSSLRQDLSRLTTQLAELRAQRRAQLPDNAQLVAYEEEAMTQRRKRRQAEQTNQQLKQALFQQTAFLSGMRALMHGGGAELPCAGQLEFHDWVHSYTALACKDARARRKEYVAHFSRSKMELARKLVLKETEVDTARLQATRSSYHSIVRLLHDGTQNAPELPEHGGDRDPLVTRELFQYNGRKGQCKPDAGDGRVIKKFASVFLFQETEECSLDKLLDVAFESTKHVGVYWPAAGYESHALDQVDVTEETPDLDEQNGEVKPTAAKVYYTDLSASMNVVDATDGDDEITVEARVLCCEQRGPNEGMILWDYVDSDALHPLPTDQPTKKTVRRNCCGAIVMRREPGGLLSMRAVSVKGFAPLAESKTAHKTPEDEETRRAVARRIGLQATECERLKELCTRSIYDSIICSFPAAFAVQ